MTDDHELLGPNAAAIFAFFDALNGATATMFREAATRRVAIDHSIENAAHVACLGLAHANDRLRAVEAARSLALRVAGSALAAAAAESTIDRVQRLLEAGESPDWLVLLDESRQEAREWSELLLDAAELAAEALVMRDVLPPEQFAVLTRAFADLPR